MQKRTFLDITNEMVETKTDFWLSEEEIDIKLKDLYLELIDKENGVYWYYKSLDKTMELAKDYKKQMDDKIKKLKYTQEKLKNLVIESYNETDEMPKYDEFNPIKIMNSSSVDIINEIDIPMEYFVKVESVKLDKKKLIHDLRNGIKVPGCRLKTKPYVKGLK